MPTAAFARVITRTRLIGLTSTLVGIALSATIAGPASAVAPPPTTPPALAAFENQTSIAAPAASATSAATSGLDTHSATAAALAGKRQTFTRGGALAWSSDTFEWYWNGGVMSSSSAYQADGYVFPNTVTLLGVKRTLAAGSEHLWHGTASIGAGVVTPWGAVNVYTTTITDNFTLTPGTLTHTN